MKHCDAHPGVGAPLERRVGQRARRERCGLCVRGGRRPHRRRRLPGEQRIATDHNGSQYINMVFRGVVWGAAGSISGLDATCHPPPTTHHPPPIRHPPQLLGRWKEKLDADYSAAVQARAAWKESMLTRRIRMSVPDLTSASAHEGGVEREGGMTRPVSTGTLGVGAGGAVGVAGAADPFPPPPATPGQG